MDVLLHGGTSTITADLEDALAVASAGAPGVGERSPLPLETGGDGSGSWLVTRPVPATSAVDPRWISDPRSAVIAIGEGLRALHERLRARPSEYADAS